VHQQLAGLWNGAKPTLFTKTGGDSWLSVSATGVVSGTAPRSAPKGAATITVSASNGTTTSKILVEVQVGSRGSAPAVKAASWNAWDDGSHVTDAVGKNLAVIAARGIDVIGFQDGGAAMADQVASALGWYERRSGDLGIVSAYPFTTATQSLPSDSVPALAATVTVDGQSVRVWDAHVSEDSATTASTQAAAIARDAARDASRSTPVILLGDLGSSSAASALGRAGLTDSYRAANRSAQADPGDTLLFASPSDRVDFVAYSSSSSLRVVDSDTLSLGWPSATSPARNSWASDHRAVVTTFDVG
jgi:endonuclease/exonuclease/phosphatase family metal-dependent hydrolase